MARDGSGNYSLAEAAFVDGTTIEAAKVNSNLNDIASALTGSLTKNGEAVASANQPMGGYRHTGVGNATSRTHYAAAGQIADNAITYAADGGSANAYTITLTPALTAYVVGQRFTFKVANANSAASPTLNVNSIGAGTIKWANGTDVQAGELPANAMVEVVVSATTPVFHLQTVATVGTVLRQYSTVATGDVATGTTVLPADDTIPQNTEGDQFMALSVQPKSATSQLIIDVVVNGSGTVSGLACALFQDSTANALAATAVTIPASGNVAQMRLRHVMTSGTTSSITFKVRAGCTASGTFTLNGSAGGRLFGGIYNSSIVITELGL